MRFWKEKRNSLIIFSSLLLTLIFFSQNDKIESLEKNLAFHMIVEHLIFFMIGASIVLLNESILKILNNTLLNFKNSNNNQLKFEKFSFLYLLNIIVKRWKSFLKIIFMLNHYPVIWIIIAIDIMIFWHIPFFFDLAALDNFTHILQHISFIIVGTSVYMTIRNFGESFNLILLVSLIGMMGISGIFFSVVDDTVYVVYDIQQHHDTGFYMVVTSLVMLIVILPVYLVKKTMFHIKFTNQKT